MFAQVFVFLLLKMLLGVFNLCSVEKLQNLRYLINEIDLQLIEILNKRFNYCLKIAKNKHLLKLPIVDLKRQEQILNKVKNLSNEKFIKLNCEIFKLIFKLSVELQQIN